MWLTSFMAKNIKDKNNAETGIVSESKAGGVTLHTSSKHTQVPLVAPWGLVCVPPVGTQALMLDTASGKVCAGVMMSVPEGLEEGELMLCSKGASVVLKNDGRVLINGKELSGA